LPNRFNQDEPILTDSNRLFRALLEKRRPAAELRTRIDAT